RRVVTLSPMLLSLGNILPDPRLSLSAPAPRVAGRARSLAGVPNHEVSLHFLVEGRTKVGAIERKHSRLGELDREGLGFTRIDHHVDVLFDQAKAVNHVTGLLDIGHMDSQLVANLRVDPVRVIAAANRKDLGCDLIAVAGYAGLAFLPNCVRILIFILW